MAVAFSQRMPARRTTRTARSTQPKRSRNRVKRGAVEADTARAADTGRAIDTARAVANVALAAAQPLAAYVSRWSGHGVSEAKRAEQSGGPVTPAPGTFAIWGPLFVNSLAFAAWSARREQRTSEALRHVGWLNGATLASTTVWSLNAQLRGLGWPSVAVISLAAASATAAMLDAGLAHADDPSARRAALSIAPLAGWLTLASFANLETTLNETRGRPKRASEDRRAALLLGAATTTAGAVSWAARGNPLYSAAVGWGLAGTLARNVRDRRPVVATAAVAGLTALTALTMLARHRA